MDAIQILKDFHRELSGLFELILITENPGEKQSIFQKVKEELDLYSLIEQHTLYPALSDGNELVKLIDRSYDEHDDMSDRAEEINQMENATQEFDSAVQDLADVFDRHVENEECDLFPKVATLLNGDDLILLGNEINELRGLGMAA